MRKIVVERTGGPEVLQLVEVDDPTPATGQVVVQAHAMAVGWPDVMIRTGVYKSMPSLPLTPGNEMVGVIESVGDGVSDLSAGQAVYISSRELRFQGGCYAEKIAVPAAAVLPLPEGTDLMAAAGLGYYSLAWTLIHDAARGFEPKTAVVIGAAGGVGSALVQIARHAGIRVIGAVSSDEKAEFARALGANEVIDYRREDIVERTLALTDGRGVDLLLDAVVGPDFSKKFDMMAPWGTMVLYNATGGFPGPDLFQAWQARAARAIGLRYFSMQFFEDDPQGRRRIMDAVLPAIASRVIEPPRGPQFPLEEAAEAHRFLESGKNLGRILLRP